MSDSNSDDSKQKRNYGPEPIRPLGWKSGEKPEPEDTEPGTAAPLEESGAVKSSMVIFGILALLAAIFAVIYVFILDEKRDIEQPIQEKRVLNGRELAAAAGDTLSGFFSAKSVDEQLLFVCEAERVAPLMRDHYGKFPLEAKMVLHYELMTSVTRYRTKHPHTLVTVYDSDNKVSLAILREVDGGVAIDWEALVAYNPVTLHELIDSVPEGTHEIRVMAKRTDYYNFGYEDSAKWQAFSLVNPNEGDIIVVGYSERGSDSYKLLMELTNGGHGAAVRLTVMTTAKSGQNVVKIEAIAAEHWLGGDA